MKSLFFLCIAAFCMKGCVHPRNQGSITECYSVPTAQSEEISFRLSRAGAVSHKTFLETKSLSDDAKQRYYQYQDHAKKKEVDNKSVRIEFTNLNDSQFERLLQIYGGWSQSKSNVKPPSILGRDFVYNLTDFLPPITQAIIGTGFASEVEPSGPSGSKTLSTNCWTTLYALFLQARDEHEPYRIFNSEKMQYFFSGDSHSSKIHAWLASGKNQTEEEKTRNKLLQPGDIVVIGSGNLSNQGFVEHVALFVDDDLYFEKPGPENRFFARLITYEELIKTYYSRVFVARRLTGAQLPPVEKFLERKFAQKEVKLESDSKTGRAILPQKLFEPSSKASSCP